MIFNIYSFYIIDFKFIVIFFVDIFCEKRVEFCKKTFILPQWVAQYFQDAPGMARKPNYSLSVPVIFEYLTDRAAIKSSGVV